MSESRRLPEGEPYNYRSSYFFADTYEKKSVLLTTNLAFSKWDQIFKDPMTTMAAVDRLVHHSIILEFTGDSHRVTDAKTKGKADVSTPAVP